MLKPGFLYCFRQAKAWRKMKKNATVIGRKESHIWQTL